MDATTGGRQTGELPPPRSGILENPEKAGTSADDVAGRTRPFTDSGPFKVHQSDGLTGSALSSGVSGAKHRMKSLSRPSFLGAGVGLLSAVAIILTVGSGNGLADSSMIPDVLAPLVDGVGSEARGQEVGAGGRSQFSRSLSGSAGAANPSDDESVPEEEAEDRRRSDGGGDDDGDPGRTDSDRSGSDTDQDDDSNGGRDELDVGPDTSRDESAGDPIGGSTIPDSVRPSTSSTEPSAITTTVLIPVPSTTTTSTTTTSTRAPTTSTRVLPTSTTIVSTVTTATSTTTTTTTTASTTTTTTSTTTTSTSTSTTTPPTASPTSCEVQTTTAGVGTTGVEVHEPTQVFASTYVFYDNNGTVVATVSNPQQVEGDEIEFEADIIGFDVDRVFAAAAVVDGNVSAPTTCIRRT